MFDPYHKWLGIPRDQQPPTCYQLLGITPSETDPEVIEEMAIRQTSHVRNYQTGPHAGECAHLLNEIAQARRTLLTPAKRRVYDANLHRGALGNVGSQVRVQCAASRGAAFSDAPTATAVQGPLPETDFQDLSASPLHGHNHLFWPGMLALGIAVFLFTTGGMTVWQVLGEHAGSPRELRGPAAATAPAQPRSQGPAGQKAQTREINFKGERK